MPEQQFMRTASTEVWPEGRLRRWILQALDEVRLQPEAAVAVAESLVEASVTGVDSHGVLMLPVYLERIRKGGIRRTGAPAVIRVSPGQALVDAGNVAGQWSMKKAAEAVCEIAGESGIGFAAAKNGNHVGCLAHFARFIAGRGFACILASNSGPSVSVHGGSSKALGNNAFCMAVPRENNWPVVLDIATGKIACGKIRWRSAIDETVPKDFALSDASGNATTDASALDHNGFVPPFGAHKGYGLAVLVDLLSAGFGGGLFSPQVTAQRNFAKAQNNSQFLIAFRYPAAGNSQPLDDYLRYLTGMPSSDGYEGRALLPGEKEELTRRERLREGIPVPVKVIEQVHSILREAAPAAAAAAAVASAAGVSTGPQ
jgi:LDH2 family malate/lactate/ureidoglycolate dehydrogenase